MRTNRRVDADLVRRLSAPGRVFKAHGTGNDFVVVVDVDNDLVDLPATVVAALCDRRTGIGGDGVIRLGGPPTGGHLGDVDVADTHVTMDYRNADGSIVEMCGNGVRVVARMALDLGLVDPVDDLAIATRDGPRHVRVHRRDGDIVAVTVDMGPAVDDPDVIGLVAEEVDGDPAGLRLSGLADWEFSAISMGNPHVVTRVDDLASVPLATIGPVVEHHPAFRAGVNVNMVQVVDDRHVRLRVWERGVGETRACGTGACATVAALAAARMVDPDDDGVVVTVAGGDLVVARDDRGHLLMTGPAVVVAGVALDPGWWDDVV